MRVTSFWAPGLSEPTPHEAMVVLANIGTAAALHGVRVYVSVYNEGSRTTPLTLTARKQFASYVAAIVRDNPSFRDVIVGNEPNLNRFWLPQFDLRGKERPRRHTCACSRPATTRSKKRRRTSASGAVRSHHGDDRPNTGRDTISPTRFIRARRGLSQEWPVAAGDGRLLPSTPTCSTRASPSTRSPPTWTTSG